MKPLFFAIGFIDHVLSKLDNNISDHDVVVRSVTRLLITTFG